MKQVYIIKKNNPKLLLFFAGWAADETPFKQYCPQGMDYMICYDYRTLDFDTSILEQYRQVNVVAWSMGCLLYTSRPEDTDFSRPYPSRGRASPSSSGGCLSVRG